MSDDLDLTGWLRADEPAAPPADSKPVPRPLPGSSNERFGVEPKTDLGEWVRGHPLPRVGPLGSMSGRAQPLPNRRVADGRIYDGR